MKDIMTQKECADYMGISLTLLISGEKMALLSTRSTELYLFSHRIY